MEKRVAISSEVAAAVLNKKRGCGTILKGSEDLMEIPKLPFGVFVATYGSGGGAPLWRCTRIRGAEGSGKTTMAISAMKQASLLCWRCFNLADYCTCSESPLRMKTLYVDAEGALDPEWIDALGVPADSYYVTRTAEGGEALDAVDSMLKADDMGLVVIDSIAHLLPPVEVERSIGDRKIASQAALITDGVAKLQVRLNSEKMRGHPCLIVCTNQLRYIIGGYGNNETEAGGQAFRHWFSLGLRMSKLHTDDKYKDLKSPVKLYQRHGVRWDKEKFSTFLGAAEFLRAREDIHNPKDPSEILYKKASVMDDGVILSYLKQYNMLEPKYRVPDIYDFELERDLKGALRTPDSRYYQLHIEITRRAKNGGRCMPGLPGADVIDNEGDEISLQ